MKTTSSILKGLVIAAWAMFAGCNRQETPPKEEPKGNDTEVKAVLAKADAYDGTADKVVSKCCGCNLAMDGSADFTIQAHDYTLHLCGAECKGHFEKDPDAAILAMKIPEKEEPTP